jgi:hypothetical protein
MGVLLIIFGCLGIAGGVFGKRFYAADIVALAAFNQRSATWSGRLVFILIGAALIAIGIKLFLGI